MREQITYRKLEADSIHGFGMQITYTFTSFDQSEIDELESRCEEQIGTAIVIDPISIDTDERKGQ